MSSSSEVVSDCTKRSDKDNDEAPQFICTNKASDICLVVLSCVVFVIATLTSPTFCAAIGVFDMRLPWFSNHSSVDNPEDTRGLGLCACDLEMTNRMRGTRSLESEVQALKLQMSDTTLKVQALKLQMSDTTLQMDALRLQLSQVQAKGNETGLMVASLMDQNNEVSATFAKINATEIKMIEQHSAILNEMEAVKLNAFNIYAKANDTSSVVSTWIEQVKALKLNVSTIEAKESQTATKVFSLMEQKDALSVNFFKMNSTMTTLEQQVSDLQSKENKTASMVSALMKQRPSANNSNSRVTACKSSAAVGFIVLLALLFQC